MRGLAIHGILLAAVMAMPSGTLAAHYAPRTALVLMDGPGLDAEVRALGNIAVLALRAAPQTALVAQWIVAPRDAAEAAARNSSDAASTRRVIDSLRGKAF